MYPDIRLQLAAERTRHLITKAGRRGRPVKPATPGGVGWPLT